MALIVGPSPSNLLFQSRRTLFPSSLLLVNIPAFFLFSSLSTSPAHRHRFIFVAILHQQSAFRAICLAVWLYLLCVYLSRKLSEIIPWLDLEALRLPQSSLS